MSASGGGDLGFSFHATKEGAVTIFRGGRIVTVLRGAVARRFLVKAHQVSVAAQQQLMARVTGNYKRGNERPATHQSR
jgi:hypothetical protein